MVNESMSLQELTARAYARGVPAGKWAKLVGQCLDTYDTHGEARQEAIIKTLFNYLPNPPAVILKYLSYCLSNQLATARTAVIHLLLQPSLDSVPSATLDTICQAILNDSTGLDASNPLPSRLDSPLPDIGPSSPASTSWTISLLLPLLRKCTTSKVALATTQLIGRILSIIEPYPAPPFDVGLEASQLMGSLPDDISIPLRQSLSGLMTDLAISEGSAQQAQAVPTTVDQLSLSRPQQVMGAMSDGPAISSVMLADAFSDAIPQAVALLLASYREEFRYDKTEQTASTTTSIPPKRGRDFLKNCWSLGSLGSSSNVIFSADVILDRIMGVTLEQVIPDLSGLGAKNVDGQMLLLENLPALLRWWKDQSNGGLTFPSNLASCLRAAFDSNKEALDAHATWQQTTWENLLASLDGDTEDGSFSPPDGWSWVTIREGMVRRLADLGLLAAQDVKEVLPDSNLSEPWMSSGESLMYRISSTPRSHIDALAFIITHAPGAARSLASEVIQTIQACPINQPPENLFTNLSSSPALLACIGAYCPPATFLDLATSCLIDKSDEAGVRSEDPQGSMTRFGEGVVLVETFAAQYKLPLPALLQEARTSLLWSELSIEEKGMMNGWIRALFGSDGIDDETLLSTTPQNFCRLGCGLFQQAITATAIDQIDLDTLHSGLSYFCQPLLSWSLGGIVTWLCREALRLGPLSALHLDVLQNLLVSSAIPESLLRTTGPDIGGLLAPRAGLGPVFLSSGFDVEAVKSKLELVGVSTISPILPTNTLISFRSDIQMLRRLELAPPSWPASIINILRSATLYESTMSCLDVIVSEIANPPIDLQHDDPLLAYAPLLLVLPYHDSRILLEPLIKRYIPALLDDPRFPFRADQCRPLVRVVRIALLLLDRVDAERVKRLMTSLVEEVKHQRSRGVEEVTGAGPMPPKKRKAIDEVRPLSVAAGSFVGLLAHAFDDEESKSRWEVLGSL